MGNTHEGAVATVGGIDGYKKQFAAVYPDEGVSIDTIAKSIASFERALVTAPSPFDYAEALRPYADYEEEDFEELEEDDPEQYERYLTLRQSAQAHPMSASAQRGRELFFSEKTNCTACHVGANLTDEKFHNIGIGMRAEEPKAGRYAISENEHERGAFKTPTIRNVASSPPYMHDGSLGTLEAVVEHYEQGGTPHEWLSKDMLKLELTPQDKADLVEFMRACSGSLPTVSRGRLPQN
jgi:cytochrome c peroxidase